MAGGPIGSLRGPLTINPCHGADYRHSDVLGWGNNAGLPFANPVNIVGGLLTNSSGGNEGFPTTFNFTGGTFASSGNGSLEYFNCTINSYARLTNVMYRH